MKDLKILGIETSCDDTGIGIIDVQAQKITNVISNSIKLHKKFGGVVPELAARNHEKVIQDTFLKALKKSGLEISEISHIACTKFPGMQSCLLVGNVFAQTLAYLTNKPLIWVDHMMGHLFSAGVNNQINFPIIGVVASGGHTNIYYAKNFKDVELLFETQDDAIGEVYDKVARALNMNYPGGPKIDAIFDINKTNIQFIKKNKRTKISYSGFKTAVLNYIKNSKKTKNFDVKCIASSFQKYIIDDLLFFVKDALNKHLDAKQILIGGGVSANSYFRDQISKLSIPSLLPPMSLTTDNGVMIAFYASNIL